MSFSHPQRRRCRGMGRVSAFKWRGIRRKYVLLLLLDYFPSPKQFSQSQFTWSTVCHTRKVGTTIEVCFRVLCCIKDNSF